MFSFVVFFFKQKTAYEMRISDWSSDVCSSDLPKDRWRIGTEHEKFVYAKADFHAPSYDERGGIHTLLIGLTRYGWNPVFEGENIIALSGADGTISLEPAGQLELSGAPLENLDRKRTRLNSSH